MEPKNKGDISLKRILIFDRRTSTNRTRYERFAAGEATTWTIENTTNSRLQDDKKKPLMLIHYIDYYYTPIVCCTNERNLWHCQVVIKYKCKPLIPNRGMSLNSGPRGTWYGSKMLRRRSGQHGSQQPCSSYEKRYLHEGHLMLARGQQTLLCHFTLNRDNPDTHRRNKRYLSYCKIPRHIRTLFFWREA